MTSWKDLPIEIIYMISENLPEKDKLNFLITEKRALQGYLGKNPSDEKLFKLFYKAIENNNGQLAEYLENIIGIPKIVEKDFSVDPDFLPGYYLGNDYQKSNNRYQYWFVFYSFSNQINKLKYLLEKYSEKIKVTENFMYRIINNDMVEVFALVHNYVPKTKIDFEYILRIHANQIIKFLLLNKHVEVFSFLVELIDYGNIEMVRFVLRNFSIDLNKKFVINGNEQNLLLRAILGENNDNFIIRMEIMHVLLQNKNLEINQELKYHDYSPFTPLVAAIRKSALLVSVLLQYSVKTNYEIFDKKRSQYYSLLDLAQEYQIEKPEILKALKNKNEIIHQDFMTNIYQTIDEKIKEAENSEPTFNFQNNFDSDDSDGDSYNYSADYYSDYSRHSSDEEGYYDSD